MATSNSVTGSYCLSKKSHVSHHIIFITVLFIKTVFSIV